MIQRSPKQSTGQPTGQPTQPGRGHNVQAQTPAAFSHPPDPACAACVDAMSPPKATATPAQQTTLSRQRATLATTSTFEP